MVFIINMLIVFRGTPRNSENGEESKFLLWIHKTNVAAVAVVVVVAVVVGQRTDIGSVTGRRRFRRCVRTVFRGREPIISLESPLGRG